MAPLLSVASTDTARRFSILETIKLGELHALHPQWLPVCQSCKECHKSKLGLFLMKFLAGLKPRYEWWTGHRHPNPIDQRRNAHPTSN